MPVFIYIILIVWSGFRFPPLYCNTPLSLSFVKPFYTFPPNIFMHRVKYCAVCLFELLDFSFNDNIDSI